MVCADLLLLSGECGCELLQKCMQCLSEAPVRFEGDGCYGFWVVFSAFVEFGEGVCVAWCNRDVGGTRQSSSCGGRGDHNVKVHGFVGCVESDVGSIELCVVVVGVWSWGV